MEVAWAYRVGMFLLAGPSMCANCYLYLVVTIQLSFLKSVFSFSSLRVCLPAMKNFGKSCRPGFYTKKLNRTCLNLLLNSSFGAWPPSFCNDSGSCMTLCECFCILFLLFVISVLCLYTISFNTLNFDWNGKFYFGSKLIRVGSASYFGAQAVDNVKCFHLCCFSRKFNLSLIKHPLEQSFYSG